MQLPFWCLCEYNEYEQVRGEDMLMQEVSDEVSDDGHHKFYCFFLVLTYEWYLNGKKSIDVIYLSEKVIRLFYRNFKE